MPFPFDIFLILKNIHPKNVKCYCGKEVEFDFSQKISISCTTGKVSASASHRMKGSVTIEAIVCIPLFLYAACSMIWMLEIRSIQTTIRCGLQYVGKQIAEESFAPMILQTDQLEEELVDVIGSDHLERSILIGGAKGICCDESHTLPGSGIYELSASFYVRLPFPYFSSYGVACKESMKIKGWNGYVKERIQSTEEDIVYVTETGIVYHLDTHCTYLEPSIRSVQMQEIQNLRNESGGKYYPCAKCVQGTKDYERVYITTYGYCYHGSAECSKLKRKVYEVPLSEVKGKVVCSKCGS